MGSYAKDISNTELYRMRDDGMTNAEIAKATGVSIQTVRNRIGKQPNGLRRFPEPKSEERQIINVWHPVIEETEQDRGGTLVVQERVIMLQGATQITYNVSSDNEEIGIYSGVSDYIPIKFDQLADFIKELTSIQKKLPYIRHKNEIW
jgi:hypothetical protein